MSGLPPPPVGKSGLPLGKGRENRKEEIEVRDRCGGRKAAAAAVRDSRLRA